MKTYLQYFLVFLSLFSLQSCYSFTGASLAPEVKSFNVDYVKYTATLYNPTLSQYFTEELQDRFSQQTRLLENTNKPDIEISGTIEKYRVSIAQISGTTNNYRAEKNKLTISIRIDYINHVEEEKSFSRTYSNFEYFSGEANLDDVTDEIVPIITEKIIAKIFNDIVADW